MPRERYLLHQGEETIHSEDLERTPKTGKQKWNNFWYYHKWHVIAGALAVLVAAFLIREMVMRENPDYEFGLVTETEAPQAVLDDMESKLELGAKDRNGDGRIVVQINNYAVGDSDQNPDVVAANRTRLIGDFQTGSVMLYFADQTGYDYMENQDGWDDSHKAMQMPDALQGYGVELTAGMRVLNPENKQYEKFKANWDAGYEVYQNVLSGNSATQPSQAASQASGKA